MSSLAFLSNSRALNSTGEEDRDKYQQDPSLNPEELELGYLTYFFDGKNIEKGVVLRLSSQYSVQFAALDLLRAFLVALLPMSDQ